MDYQETVDYILNIPLFAKKIGTENLAGLLSRLGNPQDAVKVIHVAGTNGKGSTCKALATLLEKAGKKVGLFTSPHLLSINERIRINDQMISDADFARCFQIVKEKFEQHPSFFEVMFAMAAVYFKEQEVDYAVYETGMGGRLDATNVVNPILTIITSVGLDHMQYLGNTLEEIASEKAGIIKPEVPVIYFKRDAISSRIIETRAESLHSPVIAVDKSQYIINVLEDKTIDFSLHNRYYSYDHLKIRKTSLYQVENACMAIIAFAFCFNQEKPELSFDGYQADEMTVMDRLQVIMKEGLLDFFWEGRMEEVASGIYVDGAHNVEAIDSYCETLDALHQSYGKILVFAVVQDKDYETMIRHLVYHIRFEKIIVTSINNDRKTLVEDIAALFQKYTKTEVCICENIWDAMHLAVRDRKQMTHTNIYCVGSLYLVADVKKWLVSMEEEHDKL